MSAAVQTDLGQSSETVIDFFICRGRQCPVPEVEPNNDRAPLDGAVQEPELQPLTTESLATEHPQSAKRLRQAADAALHMRMEHHGWKKTGKKGSLWAFEHRWPHLRDHAEGRNHRLPSK